ncbi:hypothetical protein B0I33_105487 [Prauserella shujinwangii]|uniref:Tat pathway signal protein n=1 Tax=Prauserella shujinwangii TaxID=1453103 RepID=A0A2T0LVM9_9PSEU|nr:hypothetical protein [Prauserella shujinwangii]PRX47903.1 hypothetical protein B0I33_105487 [Prauserella shujinwangii]
MTEENPPAGDQPRTPGSMRYQDPANTTPREPSLAEQRARRQAIADEQRRRAEEEEAARVAERKAETRRKVLIGSGVTVGLVGLVAGWYVVAQPEDVTAVCTDDDGVVREDQYCDEDYVTTHGGYVGGGFLFMPLPGGGYQQYRYNYGGTGTVGQPVSGGSYTKPANAKITTRSGSVVQRGGLGISGGSFGKGGGS